MILKTPNFFWMDLNNPSQKDLKDLTREYALPIQTVRDCLTPDHLQKYERNGNVHFLIFRSYDDHCDSKSDTVQELTRKVAVFFTENWIITIHRKDQGFLKILREKWKAIGVGQTPAPSLSVAPEISELPLVQPNLQGNLAHQILEDLSGAVIDSYHSPVLRALDRLEELEMGVFEAEGSKRFTLVEGYYLKRRAWVFKRMIRATIELLPKMQDACKAGSNFLIHVKEDADGLFFYVDELVESITSLLNLHVSMQSQKTNEVMRVLTIFSVFLLPLNIITGVYGMNFEFMPELKHPLGYPGAIALMVGIEVLIFAWFKKKGWLKGT